MPHKTHHRHDMMKFMGQEEEIAVFLLHTRLGRVGVRGRPNLAKRDTPQSPCVETARRVVKECTPMDGYSAAHQQP